MLDSNPRYREYARVHGNSVDEQLIYDRKRWPGGSMCGFVLWNQARLREYATINKEAFLIFGKFDRFDQEQSPRIIDHDAYDEWLSSIPFWHGLKESS